MLIAGIMTGTSIDAIDVALCNVNSEGGRHTVTLVHYTQAPYPPLLEDMLKGALAGTATMSELSAIPFELARAFADVVRDAQTQAGAIVELVAAHGQTLWHEPPASTWQALSGSALSALLAVPVVYDFRAADIALGGQGAPLVPFFDQAILCSSVDRVAVNIGGMANITLLPARCLQTEVMAFDTGPGNVLIDMVCRKLFGKRYDENGSIAQAGVVIPSALEMLKEHPFFAAEPPKSTGREVFGELMGEELWRRYAHPSMPSEDLITTLTEVTVWSISDHILRYQPHTAEVIVSGGGARNTYLMHRLQACLPSMQVHTSDAFGIDVDAKEAMAFALLGYRTWHGQTSNIPRATGASAAVVLGSIAHAQVQNTTKP